MNEANNRKRVYLVEDHPLMRASLAGLLEQELGLEVCGEADNARSAKHEIGKKKPDLAILELSLNASSGFDLIKCLRTDLPRLKIVVLSMHDEELYAERCIRAGADGYLMKRESPIRILEAIRDVLAGRLALSDKISAALAEKSLRADQPRDAAPLSKLSDRELEVFNLLGQGMASRNIAETLNVSTKTVHAHFERIKKKLQLSTATELTHKALCWHHNSSNF